MKEKLNYWLLQNAIGVDQQLNALLGGSSDETLSARAHRMREKRHKYWGWTANFIDKLFFWQTGHCFAAYAQEHERRHLPSEYRDMR